MQGERVVLVDAHHGAKREPASAKCRQSSHGIKCIKCFLINTLFCILFNDFGLARNENLQTQDRELGSGETDALTRRSCRRCTGLATPCCVVPLHPAAASQPFLPALACRRHPSHQAECPIKRFEKSGVTFTTALHRPAV